MTHQSWAFTLMYGPRPVPDLWEEVKALGVSRERYNDVVNHANKLYRGYQVVMRLDDNGLRPVAIINDGNYAFRLWRLKRGWNEHAEILSDNHYELMIRVYGKTIRFFPTKVEDATERANG